MPRFCVICGKVQSHSFSVFSFPSSVEKRNAWLEVLFKAKPESLKDKRFVDKKWLKNGVCELHFFRSEISNGKKRRLVNDAVPTLDIPSSEKYSSAVLKKYRTFLFTEKEKLPSFSCKTVISKDVSVSNGISLVQNYHKEISKDASLPDCTIEIKDEKNNSPKIYKSIIENVFSFENRKDICLCCGSKKSINVLFSILKAKTVESDNSLIEELSTIFKVSQEKIISTGSFICLKCLKIIEDILDLKHSLFSLIAYVRSIYNNINSNNNNDNNNNGLSEFEKQELLDYSNTNIRKSNRLNLSLKKVTCMECSKEFPSLNKLYIHATDHDEEVSLSREITSRKFSYQCRYCTRSFSTRSMLSLHIKSHSGTLECEYCGRLITSKARLIAHLRKFHDVGKEKEKSFQCKSCIKTFSSRNGLRYHELSWHKKGKPLTCEICFKVFTYPMLYKNHKLFVHGEKSILCEMCGEMFFTKSKLNIHLNAVHRKALTWSCNICNEKFTTSAFYKHHISVKHKRVLYTCSQCNVQFKKKNTLVQHMWKHGDYFCRKCNIKYNELSSFVSHMLEIHNKDISNKFIFKSHSLTVNNSEEITDNLPKVCAISKKDHDSSVVINDILMASNEFENSTLQTLSFPSSNRDREENSKYDELSNVEPMSFSNVEALEIQSVANDSIELEEDVSLINVQMLQEIEDEHVDMKPVKESVLSEKEESLSIAHDLDNDIMPRNSLSTSSSISSSSKHTDIIKNSVDEVNVIKNVHSPLNIPTESSNSSSLHLVKSHLEQSDLSELPVILQPVKNNNWSFTNSLEASTNTSIDTVMHPLTVEEVPPITREIDITIPEDDDPKGVPVNSQINNNNNNNKLHDQSLSSLSVDIDGKGDLRYVMYFETASGKE